MNITLRNATTTDLPIISEILNYGTRNKVRRGDLAWGMGDHDSATISTLLQQGSFYLAFSDDDTPVGTLALLWQDDHMWGKQAPVAGYIQRFAVAAGYSGQNIGGQILDLALQQVERHGRQYLRTALPSGNMKLRAYYENHGFYRADNKIIPPIHPAYPAAYYERTNASATDSSSFTHTKRSLFSKIRASKLFRESE